MEQRRKHPHQHNHMGCGLISLLLALVLCIGLCVPALASSTAPKKVLARDLLNNTEKTIYDILSPQIKQVAEFGGSTWFSIPASKFDYSKLSWTKSQLQVASILNGAELTQEASEAVQEKMTKIFDIIHIVEALVTDFPYDLYWYSNENKHTNDYVVSSDLDRVGVAEGSLKIGLGVLSEYQGNAGEVSQDAIAIVNRAHEKANKIVLKYANQSDYQKLLGYKNEICSLVSYNASLERKNPTRPGGDNIIFVFDGDEDTQVVCLGYANAFQYLCNLTHFTSAKIQCRTVSGNLIDGTGSGYHAWNIVTMEDGKNYLVDVTNCDIGDTGSNFLFLKGASGSVASDYQIPFWTGTISYQYLESGVFSSQIYSPAELTLSSTDYNMFTDVSADSTFLDAIQWTVVRGITNGTSDTTFSPNNTCTRAQILTFIWRYSGKPEPTVSNPFRDVSTSSYYYKAAVWAYEKGMVSGSNFNGDTPCTRAAAVTSLWILAGQPQRTYNSQFTDVAGSAQYAKAVAYAVGTGITNGTSSTTFSPDRTCTRSHIVTFLKRYDNANG